jgi:hypothetical protein
MYEHLSLPSVYGIQSPFPPPLASRTKISRPAGMRRCPAVTSRPSKSPAIQPKSRAPGHKAADPEIIMKGRKNNGSDKHKKKIS